MASQDYTIELLLKANNQLSGELEKIQWQINKLEKQVDNSGNAITSAFSKIKKWLKLAWITYAFKEIVSAVKDWVESLNEFEYASERLYKISNQSTGATREQVDELVNLAKELDKVWVATKNWIVAMQSQFATFDMTTEAIKELTPAMADYVIAEKWANAATSDYISLAQWMAQALNGNYASLTRTWFILDENTKAIIENGNEMERVNAIVDVLNSTYQWFNEYIANNTAEWKLIMLKKQFDDLKETVASSFVIAIDNAMWEISNLIWNATTWIQEHQEQITGVVNEIYTVIKNVVDGAISIIQSAVWLIESQFRRLADLLSWRVVDLFWDMWDNTTEWLNWMWWDWRDFFAWISDWLVWIWKSLALIMNTIKSVWQTIWKWSFWQWLWQSWDTSMYDENWEKLWWFQRVKNSFSATGDYLKNAFSDTKKVVQDWIDDLVKALEDNYANRVERILRRNNSKFKKLNLFWWWGWWWWGDWNNKTWKSTKDAIKEIKDTYELLTYSVDEQYKKIKELNKERQEWYDELDDKFKEADKNVKDLTKSVWELKQKLADLNKDETSDIATEFVNARRELQKMERDYAWIWEVAKQYSMEYLENFTHWWIGKYDIDALIQYKKYSDEMASVYDWMNESERQAMDEQIKYQEWYQSLNGIEKIKEDYRIKREEIQWELNEKLSALRQEELKRAEIDKQMKQYSKERLQAIDNEIKKYAYMVWEKKRYEKEYMDQLEIDYKRQQQMYDDLIRKAKELAKVRANAWWPDWTRANGWPVYSWQQYLVWEHWPELFIPSQNWSIVKNEDLWRWQEFTINVNMWWVVVNDWQDTQQMAEEIANTITRQLELYKKGIY